MWRWVAPIFKQSQIGMRLCQRILPPKPFVKKTGMHLAIPGIDTMMEFWHGQDPESLEGEAVHGYVLDEASKMDEQVYASARTTVTQTDGKFLIISTPRGKNWFYKECMKAKEEQERAAAEGRLPESMFITAPTSLNPTVSAENIAEAKRTLPKRLFEQYYLAEFLDDSTIFSGYSHILEGPELNLTDARQFWFHETAKESNVVIGVDWARNIDYTVFIAMSINGEGNKPRIVGFDRFHGKNYTEAIKSLVTFCRKFKEVTTIYHDKTGVGVAIDDQMAETDLPYQGIVFSNQSKSEMVTKLITSIEQRRFTAPRWRILQYEMDIYEVSTSKIGNMTFAAPIGDHDDAVSALLLAHSAMLMYDGSGIDVKFLDEDANPDTVQGYYEQIAADNDEDDLYDLGGGEIKLPFV
jgi:hypothetical protein